MATVSSMMQNALQTGTTNLLTTTLFGPVFEPLVYRSIVLFLTMVREQLTDNRVFFLTPSPGRTMGQEWRLYDVGGTRSSVSFLYSVEPSPQYPFLASSVVSVF